MAERTSTNKKRDGTKKKLRLVASKGIYWFRKPQELNCGTDFHRPTSSHAFKITVRVSHPARLFAEECANWFSLLWPQVDQNPNPQHWWIFKWVWRLRTPTGDIIFPKGLYKRPLLLSASFIDYNDHNYVRYALACSSTYSRKSASARSHAYAVFTDFPSFSAGLCPDHFRLIPSTFFLQWEPDIRFSEVSTCASCSNSFWKKKKKHRNNSGIVDVSLPTDPLIGLSSGIDGKKQCGRNLGSWPVRTILGSV